MSIQVKVADGSLKRVVTPWVCTAPGVVVAAHHVWVKTVAGSTSAAIKEAYPLQPDPVSNQVASTVYRNDRIEIDIDWDAPVGGEPAAYYMLALQYVGIGNESYRINAPTTAMTLTGAGGNGYHGWAGTQLNITITPYSIGDRPGDSRSVSTTIGQLPAPDQPTALSVNVQSCRAYVSYNSPGGRRQSGIQVHMYAPHIGVDWYGNYGDVNMSGGDITPWDANSIGGTDLYIDVRAYGPGGYSAWRSTSGTIPGPVTVNTYRFFNGDMIADCSNAFVGEQIWTQETNGAFTYHGYWGNGRFQIGQGWARDNGTQRRLMLRPYNGSNGWTGRDQYYGWLIKMSNPFHVPCTEAYTLRNSVEWRDPGLMYHGSSQAGYNQAFAFYGTYVNDYMNVGRVGYRVSCTDFKIMLFRTAGTGSGSAVALRAWLHRAPSQHADRSYGGGVDLFPIAPGTGTFFPLPVGWGNHIMYAEDNYRGVLLYHQNYALNPALGNVSNEFATLLGAGWDHEGYGVWDLLIYHDG